HAVAVQFVHFLVQRTHEQAHQRAYFFLRTLPVLAGEGEQGQRLHAFAQAGFDHFAHRLAASIVAEAARAMPRLRPASVAIHDDGDVARHQGDVGAGHGGLDDAQSAISSSSFALTTASTSFTARSVSFWISSSALRSSSSVMSFSLSRS